MIARNDSYVLGHSEAEIRRFGNVRRTFRLFELSNFVQERGVEDLLRADLAATGAVAARFKRGTQT
jgi:hypothetical protein